MIGTSAALLTTQLANVMPGMTPFTKLAYAASAPSRCWVYAVGFLSSFWLPEPRQDRFAGIESLLVRTGLLACHRSLALW